MPRTDAPAGPRDRRMMRQDQAAEQRPGSMLGRRDVALVPWLALLTIGVAFSLSTVLRAPAGHVDGDVLAIGLFFAGVGAAGTIVGTTAFGARFRATLSLYVGFILVALILLTALAIGDRGLDSVGFAAAVPLAAYAGMVLPRRLSRVLATLIVIVAVAVQIVTPNANGLDATLVVLLVATGWFVGMFGNLAHARVTRVSRMLASHDPIPNALNRRGFLEQLDHVLMHRGGPDRSVALLLVDIPNLRRTHELGGRAAADQLLAWIGETLPGALPPSAEVGRLDSDQFAILLPGVTVRRAGDIAQAIRKTLSTHTDASVGVATSQTLSVAADDLVRVAEAALDRARARGPEADEPGVSCLVAGTLRMTDPSRVRLQPSADSPLSYAQMRTTGKLPRVPASGRVYSTMIMQGLIVIAAAGAAVIANTWLRGNYTVYDDIIRYGGAPWVLWLLVLTYLSRSHGVKIDTAYHWVLFVGNTLALSLGVGLAMLAHGGITAPIASALYAKVLFDGAVTPKGRGLVTLALTTVGWLVVAVLGPASSLWAAPLGIALLVSSYAVGLIGHRAFADVIAYSRSLSGTDALTRVGNRVGFDEQAGRAFETVHAAGSGLALVIVDLDHLGEINRRDGHAAGDERLVRVARALSGAIPDAYSVARIGGDEFAAVFPSASSADAAATAARATDAMNAESPVAVGYASFSGDGNDLDALILTAALRCRTQKPHRGPVAAPAAA